MAKLEDKIANALTEGQTLVLGVEVLIGFQFQSVLQNGFEKLSPVDQTLKIAALAVTLFTLGLLLAPAPYDHIVARGQDSPEEHRFATVVTGTALFPFAVALAIEFYLAIILVASPLLATAAALIVLATAIFFWYGLEALKRMQKRDSRKMMRKENKSTRDDNARTPLAERIKQALTEVRIVLPGIQALLGFQFATMLLEGFTRLPGTLQTLHVLCLACIALSTILLMTPAAYHRIVEQGEDSEAFLHFTGRMILAALVFLGLGIAGDFVVVVTKVLGSPELGTASGIALLVFFYGMWFGLTGYLRNAQKRR